MQWSPIVSQVAAASQSKTASHKDKISIDCAAGAGSNDPVASAPSVLMLTTDLGSRVWRFWRQIAIIFDFFLRAPFPRVQHQATAASASWRLISEKERRLLLLHWRSGTLEIPVAFRGYILLFCCNCKLFWNLARCWANKSFSSQLDCEEHWRNLPPRNHSIENCRKPSSKFRRSLGLSRSRKLASFALNDTS
jgi:hypothetical protein